MVKELRPEATTMGGETLSLPMMRNHWEGVSCLNTQSESGYFLSNRYYRLGTARLFKQKTKKYLLTAQDHVGLIVSRMEAGILVQHVRGANGHGSSFAHGAAAALFVIE